MTRKEALTEMLGMRRTTIRFVRRTLVPVAVLATSVVAAALVETLVLRGMSYHYRDPRTGIETFVSPSFTLTLRAFALVLPLASALVTTISMPRTARPGTIAAGAIAGAVGGLLAVAVHFRAVGVVSTGVYLRDALLEVGWVCALNAAAVTIVGIAVARRRIAVSPNEA